jgi:AMP deaminase
VEWRVSIYGRNSSDWNKLATWFYDHRLSHPNVRWLIQVPRLYEIYKKLNEVQSFQEFLNNIFQPLFEITLNPGKNPALHYFLETIVGFDSVDDESKPEGNIKMT